MSTINILIMSYSAGTKYRFYALKASYYAKLLIEILGNSILGDWNTFNWIATTYPGLIYCNSRHIFSVTSRKVMFAFIIFIVGNTTRFSYKIFTVNPYLELFLQFGIKYWDLYQFSFSNWGIYILIFNNINLFLLLKLQKFLKITWK